MSFSQITEAHFHRETLNTFRLQAEGNPVYRKYLQLLGCQPENVTDISQIPFMPVEFFKFHRIVTGTATEKRIFESSGTTGTQTSRHFIIDEELYIDSLESGFRHFFGDPAGFCFLALLPAYLERPDSSLVFMMDHLIRMSTNPLSGFYLHNLNELATTLQRLEDAGQPTMLVGVTFALLDLAEQYPLPLQHTMIFETGGMKGRREELTREQLHAHLSESFGLKTIASEYGMTELLSQAWSTGNGRYHTPPWMKVKIRDPYDPFRHMPDGKSGGIDIIDLANRHSCSFIQTQDLGRRYPDGSFEVLGRFDNAVLRGCNLLVQ